MQLNARMMGIIPYSVYHEKARKATNLKLIKIIRTLRTHTVVVHMGVVFQFSFD